MIENGSDRISDPLSRLVFNPTIDEGTRALDRPKVVLNGCYTKPACLRVSMDPSEAGAAKNKIMYSFWSHYKPLPGGEHGRIRIGDDKVTHVSFAMKLDRSYDTPTHQMIHFQVYQPKIADVTSKVQSMNPGGPILSLRIVPASRRKDKSKDIEEFIIAIRGPKAEKLHYFDARDDAVLFRGKIRKGEWNRYSFTLQSAEENESMQGRVAFWFDGQKIIDRIVQWGFNPNYYAVSQKLGVELGIYRSADSRGHQAVYFDDVSIER